MTDWKKKGKSSRRKGADYERQLANLIRDRYGYPTRRGYVFYHESDVVGLDEIHCEVKAVERLNVREAYRQAVEESEKRKDGIPVLFHHKARDGWLVTLSLEDFMDMYGAWIFPSSLQKIWSQLTKEKQQKLMEYAMELLGGTINERQGMDKDSQENLGLGDMGE